MKKSNCFLIFFFLWSVFLSCSKNDQTILFLSDGSQILFQEMIVEDFSNTHEIFTDESLNDKEQQTYYLHPIDSSYAYLEISLVRERVQYISAFSNYNNFIPFKKLEFGNSKVIDLGYIQGNNSCLNHISGNFLITSNDCKKRRKVNILDLSSVDGETEIKF